MAYCMQIQRFKIQIMPLICWHLLSHGYHTGRIFALKLNKANVCLKIRARFHIKSTTTVILTFVQRKSINNNNNNNKKSFRRNGVIFYFDWSFFSHYFRNDVNSNDHSSVRLVLVCNERQPLLFSLSFWNGDGHLFGFCFSQNKVISTWQMLFCQKNCHFVSRYHHFIQLENSF